MAARELRRGSEDIGGVAECYGPQSMVVLLSSVNAWVNGVLTGDGQKLEEDLERTRRWPKLEEDLHASDTRSL